MQSFYEVREALEKEYAPPRFIEDSGMNKQELYQGLLGIYDEDKPLCLRRAEMIGYLLENAPIDLNPLTPFADKINDGVTYEPFAQWDGLGELIFRNVMRPVTLNKAFPEMVQKRNKAFEVGAFNADADYWHTIPDWHEIMTLGLLGLLKRVENEMENKPHTEDERCYLSSVAQTYHSIITYVKRLEKAAIERQMSSYAACLHALSERAPQTMYEALELSYLYLTIEEIGCERARCLGRFDIHFYPFYRHSLEHGETQEEIRELLRFYFVKFHAARRYANQPLDLCGCPLYGIPGENELTALVLDVWDELGYENPKLHIHWHPDMDRNLVERCMDMIRRGHSSMVFVQDEIVLRAYERIGIPREDAAGFEVLGCYEPLIPGVEEPGIGCAWMNVAKAVELAFFEGKDVRTGYPLGPATAEDFLTFDAFLQAFYTQADAMIDFIQTYVTSCSLLSSQINPSPVYSGSIASCMERGRDVFDGGTKYRNSSLKLCCVGTAADALLAVKKYVFDEKRITFRQMKEILHSNWEGNEALRLKIKNDKQRFGNDCGPAEKLFCEIYRHFADKLVGKPNGLGGVWRMGADSIDYCLTYGKTTAATPDGRKAGEPLNKNFSSAIGADKNGITAAIRSATAMDHSCFCDAAVFDFSLHPGAVSGEDGPKVMTSLMEVYFARGGMAYQGNVFSTETLEEALVHPENYPTLQVRVCGWNEYFTRMSRDEQESFIGQTKQNY